MSGKIYKIVSKCGDDKYVYIGSTIQDLQRRYQGHTSKYLRWLEDKTQPYLSSFIIFDKNGGYGNCEIVLVESLEEDGNVLKNEMKHINEHKENGFVVVNKNKPYISEAEKQQTILNYMATYREKHRQEYNKKLREYMGNKYKNNEEYRKRHSSNMLNRYRMKQEIKSLMAIEI